MLAALSAVADTEAHSGPDSDERTPAQRRVDALGEICRGWLDLGIRSSVAGERPHLSVVVDAEVLAGGGGRSELFHTGAIHPEVARRLGCDASLTRVVMAGDSQVLDVGRRTPVVPPPMRKAVVMRDRHCRFPGCDRPHSWCDAHHMLHWAHGGSTRLSNLLLLCRRHHRMVHAGFGLELVDGQPVFRRPDGSVLEDRAPP